MYGQTIRNGPKGPLEGPRKGFRMSDSPSIDQDEDRPWGRDYPIVVGVCPWCGHEVETEYIHTYNDPQIVEEEDFTYHAVCYHRSQDREA